MEQSRPPETMAAGDASNDVAEVETWRHRWNRKSHRPPYPCPCRIPPLPAPLLPRSPSCCQEAEVEVPRPKVTMAAGDASNDVAKVNAVTQSEQDVPLFALPLLVPHPTAPRATLAEATVPLPGGES
mmetsp:Transcript_12034/g.26331  ORF Transcript_12034/g.26331 Transcript_12034/m.26331 type:complete len:127 (-) Transcript_12034:300-680(-)